LSKEKRDRIIELRKAREASSVETGNKEDKTQVSSAQTSQRR